MWSTEAEEPRVGRAVSEAAPVSSDGEGAGVAWKTQGARVRALPTWASECASPSLSDFIRKTEAAAHEIMSGTE